MKILKSNVLLFLVLFVLLLFSFTVQAQPNYKAWSGSAVTLSNAFDAVKYYVAPARSGSATGPQLKGPACVGYINAHSDVATGTLTFYTSTNQYAITATNVTVSGAGGATNIPTLVSAANITSNGICLIRHTATESYERNRFFSGSSSNIVLMYPITTQSQAGDIIYAESASGSILIGTNNPLANFTSIGPVGTGAGIANGQFENTPFMLDLSGTVISTGVSFMASGFYLQ